MHVSPSKRNLLFATYSTESLWLLNLSAIQQVALLPNQGYLWKVLVLSPQKYTPQVTQNKILYWLSFFQNKTQTSALFCLQLLHCCFKEMTICSILKFVLRWQLVVNVFRN